MDAHARTRHCTLRSIAGPRFWRILALALLSGSALIPDVGAQSCPSLDPNQNYNCAIGPVYVLPGWGNVPWSLPQHYQDILSGDLDGDGKDELLGRDELGVHVWSFNAALGAWQPWLTTNGTGELLLPLTDAVGWNLPQYYTTLRLMNLPGKLGKVLAVRGASGLVLFEVARGVGPVTDFPAGTWTQLTPGGPFADADCFSNGKCWNDAPYYQTIRFGDLDGEPGDEVIGWGGEGIVAFKWNGSAWTSIAGLPRFADAALREASIYLTLHLADIDGEPGAELVNWENDSGVGVHKYLPAGGGAWKELTPLQGVFGNPPCLDFNPSCWSTLTTAAFGPGGTALFIRAPGCSANGGGMAGAAYDRSSQRWRTLFTGGPFDDCSGFTKPQYYETIQFARITGNALPELIGRGPGGILVYQWNGTSWVLLSNNVPALSDPVWSSDPSYWQTIKTAMIDGTGRAALLARGQTGIRTWLYQNGTLARPVPYGNFPPFVGAQGTAFSALNMFLQLGSGTIRNTYTDPTRDSTSSTLRGFIRTIVAAGNGCKDEVSADPPQYRSCDPINGATNPAYTQVVNQVIKELSWAANVVDRFTTLQTMQTQLFTVQGTEFPSLATNLQLPQAGGATGAANYLNLFASVLKIIAALAGQPELAAAGNAISAEVSVLPLFANPQNTSFQHTYSQIQGQISSIQQRLQSNNLSHKHHVLSDYALLGTVGQLVASQVWTLDEAGYLSANRQAFTLWIYQTFLPLLWEQWQVTNCMTQVIGDVVCTPPPDGAYLSSYSEGGVNFTGLLPPQTPCTYSGSSGETSCAFETPAAAPVAMVFNPLPLACQYSANSGNAWIYPAAGQPGCTLGTGPEIFANQNGWSFQVVPYDVGVTPLVIDDASHVRGIGKTGASSDVRVKVHTTLPQDLDLRTTRIALNRIVREVAGAEELINDASGNAFAPISLDVDPRATASGATLNSGSGASPRIRVDVKFNAKTRDLKFDVSMDGGTLVTPSLCMGEPPTTRLALALELRDAAHRPLSLAQVEDWLCVMDRNGNVTGLRPAGAPTFGGP